jgi:hypothetical protein
MFFDRPSRHDWDAFAEAGRPEFDESEDKWDWNSIYPYYKKVGLGSNPARPPPNLGTRA